MQISSILLDGLLCSSLFILRLFKAGKGNYDIPTYWLPATLCYHSQTTFCIAFKLPRIPSGQPMRDWQIVCCGLDCLSTILIFFEVEMYFSYFNVTYAISNIILRPSRKRYLNLNFNLGIPIRYIWMECEGIQCISFISPVQPLHDYENKLLVRRVTYKFFPFLVHIILIFARYCPYTVFVSVAFS